MARVQLTLLPGIDSVDTSYAEKGRFRANSNTRFWLGKPQVIGGWQSATATLLTGVCRALMAWTDLSGNLNVAAGTHTNLEVLQNGVLYDITPSGFVAGNVDAIPGTGYGAGQFGEGSYSQPSSAATFALTWSLAPWGQNLMACARGGPIYWWQNGLTTPAAPLTSDQASGQPGPPQAVTYMLTTPQRTVLAVGCTQGYQTGSTTTPGPFNPLCIRESDVEDPTDWAPASTNLSSETVLDGAGRLVGARVLGLDVIFAWTDTGLYQGQWTGDASQPRAWTLVATGCGLIGPNAAVVVGQTAYWMSPDCTLWSCAVGGSPTPTVCPIIDELRANIASDQGDKVVASRCLQFQEVRFGYPDTRDQVPGSTPGLEDSRALVMSLVETDPETGEPIFWWDGLIRTAFIDAKPASYPLATTPAGNLYYHEVGATADGAAFSWYFESADQYLSDSQQVMFLGGMWPDFQDQQGPISIYLMVRQYPQAPESTYGPFACAPPMNGLPGTSKIDFRLSGRLARIRVTGNSVPTSGRLGLPAFDIEPAGER